MNFPAEENRRTRGLILGRHTAHHFRVRWFRNDPIEYTPDSDKSSVPWCSTPSVTIACHSNAGEIMSRR